MRKPFLIALAFLLALSGPALAQDTATPIPVVVTVILVWPTATPTLTPTDGPTPTATATATTTPNASTTYYSESGEDITLVREVRPSDAPIIGLLFIIAALLAYSVLRQGWRGQ